MLRLQRLIERAARHLGGPRVLALPFIRVLAVLSGYTWVALAPDRHRGWTALDVTMLAFLLYSLVVIALLWVRTAVMLRLHLPVLLVDLAFALLLIHLTGGAYSTLFLALLLIAALQSYYYGITQGVLVAVGAAAAYLVMTWPTIGEIESANMVVRLAVLFGTAIGVGVLAHAEESERRQVLRLSTDAHQRERFIRSVVESLGEGLIALDREGRVTAWNQALETRYGVAAAEALGRPLFELNPAIKGEELVGPLERLLRGEIEEFALEGMAHQTLRRGPVRQNIRGRLLRHNGQPAGAVLLIEDITGRLELERAARQADKLAALGTLAAGLAHELNNPIGIISSRIELMLLEADGQVLPAATREDLVVLRRHAQRVARIVQGLLSFARQSGRSRGPVDLNQVVDDTLLLVEKQAAKEGVMLARRLTPGLPPIQGDPTALEQVLMNLILNARDAVDGRGEILIETDLITGHPDQVRLMIRDTGPGIPAEVLPRIFDPFFTTKPSGTGLGLSISYGIVREHGGTVDVHSERGRGTTFVLSFPASPAEVEA
ncbi:MAG TPA: ATP-binding protein [Methylomirabilota bacterium]|nr:ATP-binding protein [Methylomirabilota bacterium]